MPEADGRPGRTAAAKANIVQHLSHWQAPKKVADDWQPKAEAESFVVYEKNWPTVRLFLAMETQWRVTVAGGLGGSEMVHTGLDYAALAVVAKAFETPLDEATMRKLRVMETEALTALGEARKRRAKARANKPKAQKRKRR